MADSWLPLLLNLSSSTFYSPCISNNLILVLLKPCCSQNIHHVHIMCVSPGFKLYANRDWVKKVLQKPSLVLRHACTHLQHGLSFLSSPSFLLVTVITRYKLCVAEATCLINVRSNTAADWFWAWERGLDVFIMLKLSCELSWGNSRGMCWFSKVH